MKIRTIQNIESGEYLTKDGTFTSNYTSSDVVSVNSIDTAYEYNGTLNGRFNTDFPYLGTYQIGNCQGGVRANATYQYIKCGDQDLIAQDTKCTGTAFDTITKDIDFGQTNVSASIDINGCLSTSASAPECIFAIGQDVSSFGDNICMFIFAYKLSGVCHIIIQYVDSLYSDITHRRDITVQNGVVDILIDQDRIVICGKDYKLDLDDDVEYTFGIIEDVHSFTLKSDNAHIIKKTTIEEDPDVPETNIVDDGYSPSGSKFVKTISKNLNNISIFARIDLSKCISGKNENILSIGTDITQWGSSANNLHIYYNGSQLEFDAVDKNHPGNQLRFKTEAVSSDLRITLTKEGLRYENNDRVGTVFDSTNSIVKSLCSAEQIQVGSAEGDVRSNATYDYMYYIGYIYSTTVLAQDQVFDDTIDNLDKLEDLSISFNTADCHNGSTLFRFSKNGQQFFLVKYICKDGDYIYLSVLLKAAYDRSRMGRNWIGSIVCEYKIPYLNILTFDLLHDDGMVVNGNNRIYLECTMPYLSAKKSGTVKLKQGVFGGYAIDKHGRFIEGSDLYPPSGYAKSSDALYDVSQYIRDDLNGFLLINGGIVAFGDQSINKIDLVGNMLFDDSLYLYDIKSGVSSNNVNSIDKDNHLCINRRQSGSKDVNNPRSGYLPTVASGLGSIGVRICEIEYQPGPA